MNSESLWSVFADEMDGLILMTKENISESYVDFFCETSIQKEQSLLWVCKQFYTTKRSVGP